MSEELKTVTLTVELTYDAATIHGNDPEAVEWFNSEVLGGPDLLLHSNEIGDTIGTVRVIDRPAPVQVPSGWRLVPVEPTLEMMNAGSYLGDERRPSPRELPIDGVHSARVVAQHTAGSIYRAMLAAAPSAPAARESGAQECMTHGAAVPVVPKAMYDQLMSNYITLSNQPVAQGGGVDAEKVMALVEEYGNGEFVRGLTQSACSEPDFALLAQIRALLASPAGMGWIPVGERLPERDVPVLCGCWFDGPHDWRMKVGSYSGDSLFYIPGGTWRPTHWQPLPPPPAIANQGEASE